MNAVSPIVARPAPRRIGELRRAVLRDHAGNRLGEVPLGTCAHGARFPVRHAAAQVLVAGGANWADRPCTGDAMQVVIGRRACFGYVIDADDVCWFSQPRLTRADRFSSLADGEIRKLLYDLHAGDPDLVSEIIWETPGRISVHGTPALPAGIDPRMRCSPDRERDSAAYWSAIVRILTDSARGGVDCHRAATGQAVAPAAWTNLRVLNRSDQPHQPCQPIVT